MDHGKLLTDMVTSQRKMYNGEGQQQIYTCLDSQGIESRVVETRFHGLYVGAEDVDLDEHVAHVPYGPYLAHDLLGLLVQELGEDFDLICSNDLEGTR
jgi:hypothetical protein